MGPSVLLRQGMPDTAKLPTNWPKDQLPQREGFGARGGTIRPSGILARSVRMGSPPKDAQPQEPLPTLKNTDRRSVRFDL